jgi:thiosulfate reductase cytochrome b subunit
VGPLAIVLAKDHTVIVPDLRGIGMSDHPDTGYTKKNQAVDIAGVMDALKVQKADLVTHDIGNMVSYALAAQYPDRVMRWVVIDAPLPGIGDWDNIVRSPMLWHFDFRHVPGPHHYSSPPDWIYNHMSLGPGMLGLALRLHWLCVYLFMLNGMVYVAGLAIGGGWRALLPRQTDLLDALRMFRYYVGFPFAKLVRRQWPHPLFNTKYNALQRAAYFSVPIAAFLSVATGWAIHKPVQLHWLAALFGGYNAARVLHFWLMWICIQFVVPRVILVFADGWDTLRSMIVGWSTRVERPEAIANEQ